MQIQLEWLEINQHELSEDVTGSANLIGGSEYCTEIGFADHMEHFFGKMT
jgi:hypothetical protein